MPGIAYPSLAQNSAAPSIQQNAEKQIEAITPQLPPQERILTGENDIVILMPRKFFTAKLDSGFTYLTNAYSSDNNKKHDSVFNENLSLKFQTLIAEKYTVFADAGAFAARHALFTELNYDGIAGNIGVRVPAGPWTIGMG